MKCLPHSLVGFSPRRADGRGGHGQRLPFYPEQGSSCPTELLRGVAAQWIHPNACLMTRERVHPHREGSTLWRSWGEKPTCRTPLAKGTCRWSRGHRTKESFSLLLAGLAPSQEGAGQQTGAQGAEQPVSTAHSTELDPARWHYVSAGEREDSEGRKGGADDEKSPRNLAELNAVRA